jgi:predicted metal-binding membrane protein
MTPEARERRRIRTPVVAVAALAWAMIVLADPPWSAARESAPAHAGAGHHAAMGSGMSGPHGSTDSTTALVVGWALMLTAMMSPLLIPTLRHVYARSLRRRRVRAMSLVTLAATATWAIGGLVLLGLAQASRSVTGDAGLALLLGLLAAVAWQLTPLKQYCLNRHCALPPIAAFGWAADRGVLRFGSKHAAWCLGSCWALMLVALLAPEWQLATMLVVSGWMWVETFDRPQRPTWRLHLPMRFFRIAVVRAGAIPVRQAACGAVEVPLPAGYSDIKM